MARPRPVHLPLSPVSHFRCVEKRSVIVVSTPLWLCDDFFLPCLSSSSSFRRAPSVHITRWRRINLKSWRHCWISIAELSRDHLRLHLTILDELLRVEGQICACIGGQMSFHINRALFCINHQVELIVVFAFFMAKCLSLLFVTSYSKECLLFFLVYCWFALPKNR